MYSIKLVDGHEKRTAKGAKQNVIKRELTHDQYRACLTTRREQMNSFKCLRSVNQQIYSMEINKTSLSCFDNKRFILEDGITSLPYGHYKLH